MAAKKDFDIGDIVWAKMKNFPFWPAKIVEPPIDSKSTRKKKPQHYVFFFGSENYAWIQDENIVHHSEEMLQSTSSKKKKSTLLKVAVQQIIEDSRRRQETKLLVKEEESPEASTSGTEKKTAKVQRKRGKKEIPTARKKVVPNRRSMDKSSANTRPTTTHTFRLWRPTRKEAKPRKIGFIGLGMMGQRLVKHLLNAGQKVTVWNRTFEKCIEFAKIGAALAQTPRDLVRKCDITFCCVSDSDAAKSVVFGKDGILLGFEMSSPGSKGYVEMTTMDPMSSMIIGAAVNQRGGRYLEAPINGTLKMAEEGTVKIYGAGDIVLFKRCAACFQVIAHHAYHLNRKVGAGSEMNLIHSALNGISRAAFAEAMALVMHCNLPVIDFLRIITTGLIDLPFVGGIREDLLSYSYEIENYFKYQQKDLQLALSLVPNSDELTSPMMITAVTNELFKLARFRNCRDLFFFYFKEA